MVIWQVHITFIILKALTQLLHLGFHAWQSVDTLNKKTDTSVILLKTFWILEIFCNSSMSEYENESLIPSTKYEFTFTCRPLLSISAVHLRIRCGMSVWVSLMCAVKSTPNVVMRRSREPWPWPHSQCNVSRQRRWLDNPHCQNQRTIEYIPLLTIVIRIHHCCMLNILEKQIGHFLFCKFCHRLFILISFLNFCVPIRKVFFSFVVPTTFTSGVYS